SFDMSSALPPLVEGKRQGGTVRVRVVPADACSTGVWITVAGTGRWGHGGNREDQLCYSNAAGIRWTGTAPCGACRRSRAGRLTTEGGANDGRDRTTKPRFRTPRGDSRSARTRRRQRV